MRGAPRLRPHHRLARRPALRARPRRAGRSCSARCWPSWPSASTCGCWCGPARRCRSFTPRARRSQGGRNLIRGHADPLRARPAGAPVPLPSREDGGDRRRARLRRRHRHDRQRGRPLRHIGARGAPAPRLARRRHAPARPGRGRRARALPAALAGADRRERSNAPPGARVRPATHTVQVVRTVAEGMYDRVPHGDFRILESYVRALRSARRFDLPREPVPVGAGDRRDPRRQAPQTRRSRTSGS